MIVARLDSGGRKKTVVSANFAMRLCHHLASLKLVTKDYGKHYQDQSTMTNASGVLLNEIKEHQDASFPCDKILSIPLRTFHSLTIILTNVPTTMVSSHNGEKPLVLLTGPNGFVGAHALSGLLHAGYRVRGVVRSLPKAPHLEKSHAEHVKSDDLTCECVPTIQQEGALDAVMADIDFWCHVASPYFTTSDNPLQDLIEPAVNVTRNVMASALKSTTLKRLTVMLSFASVVDLAKNPRPGHVYTSKDWDPLTVEEGERRIFGLSCQ